jgi:Mg-chelatase subunit ChlD
MKQQILFSLMPIILILAVFGLSISAPISLYATVGQPELNNESSTTFDENVTSTPPSRSPPEPCPMGQVPNPETGQCEYTTPGESIPPSQSNAIEGTEERDDLTGTNAADNIEGHGKDDTIHGQDGNDRIEGDKGNDFLYGDGDNDHIEGGDKDDLLDGGDGDDTLSGGDGDDSMTGGKGADYFSCGDGDQDRILDYNEAEGDTKAVDCEVITTSTTNEQIEQSPVEQVPTLPSIQIPGNTNEQIEQSPVEQELTVLASVIPENIIRYVSDEFGLVEISREQCFKFFTSQQGDVLDVEDPSQGMSLTNTATPNITNPDAAAGGTTTVRLELKGAGGVQQSSLPIDVVIAIDSSGSMEDNDPNNLRLAAAQAFVDKLSPTNRDQSGLVSWDDDIDFTFPLTSDSASTKNNIGNIDSSGDTNLDVGLNAAISVHDSNTRTNPSSKAIIFLSDGEENYTPSGSIGSPVDVARSKGYKIYSIGLNIQPGSIEEAHLKDISIASGGQYYFPPTAENLQAAFDDIFQSIVSSTEPSNIDLVEVLQDYVSVNENSFSINPTSLEKNDEGNTIIKWVNLGQLIGNKDDRLSANETFNVDFSTNILSTVGGNASSPSNASSLRLPINVEGESLIQYENANGISQIANIPQTYVNVKTEICEKEPFRIAFDTFIVPGSNNGSFGVYEEDESNIFKPDEEVELYAEYVGLTQKPLEDEFGDIQFLTNVTADHTITDKQGNPINVTYEVQEPFIAETSEGRTSNGSGSYMFRYYPITGELDPGEFILNYNLTDNLSGETLNGSRDFIIEGEKGEFQVVNYTFVMPGSSNGTHGVYQQHRSKIFKANEPIELYAELVGMTQKRVVDNLNNSRYLTNVSETLDIVDEKGNVIASPTHSEGFGPFAARSADKWVSTNNSYVFGFNPASPPLKSGFYILNFTIADNLSGEKVNVVKDVLIEGEKEDFRITFDTFIIPGSNNGTTGVYEEHGSNVFKPDEEIHLYSEYVGLTQKPLEDEFGNIQFLTNTTGNFTVTDNQGNSMNSTYEFEPFSAETSEGLSSNGSGSYTFWYYSTTGALEPGDYVLNYSITDNLSGETTSETKDFKIANRDLSNANDSATVLLPENFTETPISNKSVLPSKATSPVG